MQNGLMVAARYEHLDENVTGDADRRHRRAGRARRSGRPIVDSGELGVNYWHSKRFRATFNYVVNHFGQGSDANGTLTALTSPWEQEFLFRLAIAL